MKAASFPVGLLASPGLRGEAGAALIIVLACIVLISGLVVAFLGESLLEMQISTASSNQASASLFARGAVDSVIGELKQEITAGSATYYPPSGSDTRDPNCFFLPVTNQAMVPYRMDPGAPVNVIKRSAYNLPFYAGTFYNSSWPAPNWAANFSTTNADTSGRSISLNRWNQPLLMPTASSTSTNITPVDTFNPPDWIYMTRTEGPATSWSSSLVSNMVSGSLNTNCVVGRYAYVVYDEGGLLDANAAGYPSSVTTSMVRNKISEACADLTQIGLNTTDITTLINWRNPVNGTSAQAYTNYIYSPNTNAFLTPESGERMFTSRQQLIDFLMQNVAVTSSDIERMQGALPYLTHFSRELNAPSWYPQTNVASSGPYSYFNNATNSTLLSSTTNIFIPLARATSSFTDDTNSLTVLANQPVAFARFPLSRLSWLGAAGPANGATAAQIQQSFGLVWDPTYYAWQYVGPTGGTVQTAVLPLNQITGREPNFFELLKAGILAGSVGIVPMQVAGVLPSFSRIDGRYGIVNSSGVMTNIPDQQIMQIGLSSIDQASSAPLPARVEFNANTGSAALYGDKNLPYIYKVVFSPYRPATEPMSGTNQVMFDAWSEPVFWSPYHSVVTNTAPLQIRIRADGTNSTTTPGQIGAQTIATINSSTADYVYEQCQPEVSCGPAGPNTGVVGGNGSSFELDTTSAATLANATATPALLASLLNGNTYVINDVRAATVDNLWPDAGTTNLDVYTESGTTYAGFWLGHVAAPDSPATGFQTSSAGTPANYNAALFYSGLKATGESQVHAYVLEANYGTATSPSFQEVQRMSFQYTSGAQVEENDNFASLQRRLNFFTFNDPRTGRFGFDQMQPKSYLASGANSPVSATDNSAVTWTTFAGPATNSAYFSGLFTRNILQSTPSITFPFSGATFDTFQLANNASTFYSSTTPAYDDADGVQRLADGWYKNNNFNTLPMREDTPQDAPVILNRNFYSVGELGYVFRDMPWRSLNFSSATSADAGLLDLFCINDGYAGMTNAPVIAGVVDLNTGNPQVLAAMLSGAARAQLYPANDVNTTDATSIANAMTNITWNATTPLPLLNKSEIATRLAPADPTVFPTATSEPNIDSNIKERREVIVRALASAGQVRTWNLMIDVIAQTGHLPPTATGFNNFIVTAEQRYWAHVAIDRYTGQVISLQLEPVSQ